MYREVDKPNEKEQTGTEIRVCAWDTRTTPELHFDLSKVNKFRGEFLENKYLFIQKIWKRN